MSNLWEEYDINEDKIKLIKRNAELWFKGIQNTNIPNRVFQILGQTAIFERIEDSRQKALRKCGKCPFQKIFKATNPEDFPQVWAPAIHNFVIEGKKCSMLAQFSIEIRRELHDIYNLMKEILVQENNEMEVYLPLYHNVVAGFLSELMDDNIK
jgi:hypothetical protein